MGRWIIMVAVLLASPVWATVINGRTTPRGTFSTLSADGQHADSLNCTEATKLTFVIDVTGTITVAIAYSIDGSAPWITLTNSSTSSDAAIDVSGMANGYYAPVASSTSGGSAVVKWACTSPLT